MLLTRSSNLLKGCPVARFCSDAKTAYAVIHALEIIGEATKRLPESVKKAYPDLPWRSMAGMRDKLIHDYFGVDFTVIWKTVSDDLPDWKCLCAAL